MGHNDHIDLDLLDAVNERLEEGLFEVGTKEYGVAMQVSHQGLESLSPKQRTVWDLGVVPILSIPVTIEQKMRKITEEGWEP